MWLATYLKNCRTGFHLQKVLRKNNTHTPKQIKFVQKENGKIKINTVIYGKEKSKKAIYNKHY